MKLMIAIIIASSLSDAGGLSEFESITIDANADRVVYAVTTADVNNDKQPDIVACLSAIPGSFQKQAGRLLYEKTAVPVASSSAN